MRSHTRLMTPREVAARFALHPHTVSRALCGALELDMPPAFKVGGQWRFREDDVDAHIDKLSGRASAGIPSAPQVQTTAATRGPGRPRKIAPTFLGGAE